MIKQLNGLKLTMKNKTIEKHPREKKKSRKFIEPNML